MPRVIAEVHRANDRIRVRVGGSEEVMSIREARELMRAIDSCIDDVMTHSNSISTFRPVYISE